MLGVKFRGLDLDVDGFFEPQAIVVLVSSQDLHLEVALAVGAVAEDR